MVHNCKKKKPVPIIIVQKTVMGVAVTCNEPETLELFIIKNSNKTRTNGKLHDRMRESTVLNYLEEHLEN